MYHFNIPPSQQCKMLNTYFPFYSAYKSTTVAVLLFPNVGGLTCENTLQVMVDRLELDVSV